MKISRDLNEITSSRSIKFKEKMTKLFENPLEVKIPPEDEYLSEFGLILVNQLIFAKKKSVNFKLFWRFLIKMFPILSNFIQFYQILSNFSPYAKLVHQNSIECRSKFIEKSTEKNFLSSE